MNARARSTGLWRAGIGIRGGGGPVTREFVSDERAAQHAMELIDQLEAELLQRPATFEDLEHLGLAYGAQARIEARQRADRTRLERQREHAAALDEAQAKAKLWEDWQVLCSESDVPLRTLRGNPVRQQ